MNSFEQNEERVKTDVNTVIQSVSNGQPDTGKLRDAASDILNTAASLLSDTGIDGLTGNGAAGVAAGKGMTAGPQGDGAAEEEAGGIFKKLRDGLGLNGNALDQLRHAADQLKNNNL